MSKKSFKLAVGESILARYNRIFKDFEDIKKEIDEAIGPVEKPAVPDPVFFSDDENPLDHVKELLKEIEDRERVAVSEHLDSEELSTRLSLSTRLRMQEIVPGINVSESIAEPGSADIEELMLETTDKALIETHEDIEKIAKSSDPTPAIPVVKDPAVESRKKAQARFDQPHIAETKKKKRRRLVKGAEFQTSEPAKPFVEPSKIIVPIRETSSSELNVDVDDYLEPLVPSGVTTKRLEAEKNLNELDALLEKLENKSLLTAQMEAPLAPPATKPEEIDSAEIEEFRTSDESSKKNLFKNPWFWVVTVFILLVTVGILLTVWFSKGNTIAALFEDPPTYESSLVSTGQDAMNQPFDVAIVDGNAYVTDSKNQVVRVFDENGEYADTIGEKNDVPFFSYPYGIAADEEGVLYITDLNRGEILKYTQDGEFLGSFITEDVTLDSPGAIRIIDEKLYVTDVTTSKAYVFSLDGELLQTIEGTYDGKELSILQAITADDQYIYLSDTGNARVLKLTLDGDYVSTITNFSSEDSRINIRGLAVDQNGNLYVVDRQNNTVECFNQDGDRISTLSNEDEDIDLGNPNGLCIDGGELYVTNILNNKVDVFALPE